MNSIFGQLVATQLLLLGILLGGCEISPGQVKFKAPSSDVKAAIGSCKNEDCEQPKKVPAEGVPSVD